MGKTYTVKQVADILGYSTNSIYTFLKEGRIVGVRLGKGRFRIPEAELAKILHLKKIDSATETISEPVASPVVREVKQITPIVESTAIPSLERHLEEMKINSPSLFDWFVSLVSIIIGFTMALFVRNFEEFAKVPLSQYFIPIEINLLFAGLGLIAVNYLNQIRKGWFYLFYIIILVNFIAYDFILFLGKDLLGFFFFFLVIAMMLFRLIINSKGAIVFRIFMTSLSIVFPIVLTFYPSVIDFNQISIITGLSTSIVLIFILSFAILINVIIWFFHKEKGPVYWVCLFFVSLGLAYYSYLYSTHLYWSRTMMFILVILFLMISSFWDNLNTDYKSNRRIIINIFTDIVLIFIVITSLIWVIQNNTRSKIEQTLTNKLVYGQNVIATTLKSSQDKLESLAANQLFKTAYEKKDLIVRDGLIKNIFDYSSSFRRIVLADKDGNVISYYPSANLTTQNVAFRDYFKQVKSTLRPFVSDIYSATVNNVNTRLISINVPILDGQDNFDGILIGSLDINGLSNNLKQIASQPDNEYFILIDSTGNAIIQPQGITLSIAETKQLLTDNSSNFAVENVSDSDNKLIQIVSPVDDIGWKLIIRRPLLSTYNFDDMTNILLNLTFIFSGLLIIYLNIMHAEK